jgi:UDP-glucose 4-epimerase
MVDRILLVGAGGFVGRHLALALHGAGSPVLAVASAGRACLPGIETTPLPADIAGIRSLLSDCRAVVHVAARSTPASSAGRPVAELDDNLAPLLAILEAMQATPDVALIYFSSGGSIYAAAKGGGSIESSPLAPRSYHGAAKVAAEYFIRAWSAQFGNPAIVLRPSNIYGPGQWPREGFGVIPNAMQKLRRAEPLTIWGDGSARRDYLFVDDLVGLCQAVLAAPIPAGATVLNASSGSSLRLDELLSAIESASGQRLDLRFDSSRAVDASNIAISSELANALYGWRATTSLEIGLRRTWEWLNTLPA